MLARATDSTQAPTPGYLYLDIAKNAGASPMASQEVAQYLTKRLSSKTNPNIKYKCLKVIAKTATSSATRGQFQRVLGQDAQAMSTIKECLQFRGPPDPARGDEPYNKVRTAAKEALDAIYSDDSSGANHTSQIPTSRGIGGMGGGGGMPPSSYSGGGGGGYNGGGSGGGYNGGGGERRMEGIGNPMFQDPRIQKGPPDTMDVLREVGRTVKNMIEDPLASRVPTGPVAGYGGGGGSGGNPGYKGGGFNPPGRSALASNTGGAWSMASNRGPNAITGNMDSYYQQKNAQTKAFDWASNNSSGASISSGGVGGSWGAGPAPGFASSATNNTNRGVSVASAARQPAIVGYGGSTNPSGTGGTASADGSYERNLVLELCPPGGVKAEPPQDKLLRFQQAIPIINADLVCPTLLDCLEEGQPWIMRGKALCVMRTCIEFGVGEDGANKYADFFYECRAEIEPLVNHTRPAIREPAKQILQLLGIATPVSPSKATMRAARTAPAAPAAPAVDLLDFSSPSPAPQPVAAPPAPVASSGGGGSLFGGLTVQGSKEETTAAVEAEPIQPAQQQVETSAGESLLEAMSGPSSVSAFGFMGAPTAPAAAAPTDTAGSAFGFMQPEAAPPTAETTTTTTTAVKPVNTSAFDFMEPPKTTPMESTTPTRPVKKPATFDPLAQDYQESPNTEKRRQAMMAQQQMAAAAMYSQQQMLMMQHQMQQQQMQQMQFAYMQQAQNPKKKPNVMVPQGGGMAATSSFSFLDIGAKPPSTASKRDNKFDFIQDALKDEQKK